MSRRAVMGIDAGGSKTLGVVVSLDGVLLASARRGNGNYQVVGRAAAAALYNSLLDELRGATRRAGASIAATAYGLSGLDRPRDEAVLRDMLAAAGGFDPPHELVNDAWLVLRAGTVDGVGIAVVSGTGANCVGTAPDGRRDRIGGLCWELGDFGGAQDIGIAGMRAAFRGADGRGRPTQLSQQLSDTFELGRLDDLFDRLMPDASDPLDPGEVAPLVFAAATAGDAVAQQILEDVGNELGHSAHLLADRLFDPGAPFDLVMGGSVLQHGTSDVMRDALVAQVRRQHPAVTPQRLDGPPVLGAVLLACDRLDASPGPWREAGWVDAVRHQLEQVVRS